MINKENMRKWVAALRGGEFEQGYQTLRMDHGGVSRYCCMGVATELAIADGVPLVFAECGYRSTVNGDWCGGAFMPGEVMQWLGLPSCNPTVGVDAVGDIIPATTANDSLQQSFGRIADGIEHYYDLNEE